MDADGYGNIEVVDDAVGVEILKSEVGDQDHGAGAENIGEAVDAMVLELRTGMQGLPAQHGGEGIAQLIAVHARGLRQIEVGAVGKDRGTAIRWSGRAAGSLWRRSAETSGDC